MSRIRGEGRLPMVHIMKSLDSRRVLSPPPMPWVGLHGESEAEGAPSEAEAVARGLVRARDATARAAGGG